MDKELIPFAIEEESNESIEEMLGEAGDEERKAIEDKVKGTLEKRDFLKEKYGHLKQRGNAQDDLVKIILFWVAKLTVGGFTKGEILQFLKKKNLVAQTNTWPNIKRFIGANKDIYDEYFAKHMNIDYNIEISKGTVDAKNKLIQLIDDPDPRIALHASKEFLSYAAKQEALDLDRLKARKGNELLDEDVNPKLLRAEYRQRAKELLAKANSRVVELQPVKSEASNDS